MMGQYARSRLDGGLREVADIAPRLIALKADFLAPFVNYPVKAPFPVREAARHSLSLGLSVCVRHAVAKSVAARAR